MIDLILDIINNLVKYGLSWAAMVLSIVALFRNKRLRKRFNKYLPPPLRDEQDSEVKQYVHNQHIIMDNQRRIMAHLGVEGWKDADYTVSPNSAMNAKKPFDLRIRYFVRFVRQKPRFGRITTYHSRRGTKMKNLLRKLGSRKFWVLVSALVTSNLVLFGVGDDMIVKVAAMITQFGSVVVYILAEASVDREAQRQVKGDNGDDYSDHGPAV